MNISHVLAVHGNSERVPHVTFVFCFSQRFARSSLVVSSMEIQMSLRTSVQDKRATKPSFAESRGWTYILTDPINPPLFKIRTLRSKKRDFTVSLRRVRRYDMFVFKDFV